MNKNQAIQILNAVIDQAPMTRQGRDAAIAALQVLVNAGEPKTEAPKKK
jgi:hypothetical protein